MYRSSLEKCHVEFSYPRIGGVFPFVCIYFCVFDECLRIFLKHLRKLNLKSGEAEGLQWK